MRTCCSRTGKSFFSATSGYVVAQPQQPALATQPALAAYLQPATSIQQPALASQPGLANQLLYQQLVQQVPNHTTVVGGVRSAGGGGVAVVHPSRHYFASGNKRSVDNIEHCVHLFSRRRTQERAKQPVTRVTRWWRRCGTVRAASELRASRPPRRALWRRPPFSRRRCVSRPG